MLLESKSLMPVHEPLLHTTVITLNYLTVLLTFSL